MPITNRTQETADDAGLGKVIISSQTLLKAEKLLEQLGLKEAAMSPDTHHLLVGMCAYMLIHNSAPKTVKQMAQFVAHNKARLMQLQWPAADDAAP